jgi:hypothetical protein
MTQVAIGRMDEARQVAALFMVSNPHFTISFWAASLPFTDEAMRDHFIEGIARPACRSNGQGLQIGSKSGQETNYLTLGKLPHLARGGRNAVVRS